jgi:copper chaperone NosL
MNKPGRVSFISMVLALIAAALLITSLKLPLWHLRMESPQYQDKEALRVEVLPGSMRGDLNEIRVLNKYIGVRIPDTLPQTRWLPIAIWISSVAGFVAVLLARRPRRFATYGTGAFLAASLLIAAGQAQWQMYHVGHDRNQHAALVGVKDFTPPLLGNLKVANFELKSRLGLGTACIVSAILLNVVVGLRSRAKKASAANPKASAQTIPAHAPEHPLVKI